MWMRALALCAALVQAAACKGGSAATNAPPAPAVQVAPAASIAHVEQALAKIVATLAEAQGKAELRRKGDPAWEPAAVGAAFRERDWVRTGAGAFARVRFVAGGFLDLRENTSVLIDTAISVDTGTLVAVAEPGAQPLVIKAADGTEARIVAAPGETSELRLTPSDGSGLEVAVTKGTVQLVTSDGERTVTAGEASDLAKAHSGAVVKLLGFPKSLLPGVDARFLFAPAMQIALTWKPVKGAARYHVQVARDTEFRELVLDADAAQPRADLAPDVVGVYAWRTAAVDATGRLGEYGFARRIYVEADQPRDLLLTPPDGAKIGYADSSPRITFSWQSSSETTQYRLVIGTGADPTIDTVASIVTSGQQLEVHALDEGEYHWGVYAVHDKHESPIFLAPHTLTVHRQLVRPETDKLWDQGAHH